MYSSNPFTHEEDCRNVEKLDERAAWLNRETSEVKDRIGRADPMDPTDAARKRGCLSNTAKLFVAPVVAHAHEGVSAEPRPICCDQSRAPHH